MEQNTEAVNTEEVSRFLENELDLMDENALRDMLSKNNLETDGSKVTLLARLKDFLDTLELYEADEPDQVLSVEINSSSKRSDSVVTANSSRASSQSTTRASTFIRMSAWECSACQWINIPERTLCYQCNSKKHLETNNDTGMISIDSNLTESFKILHWL